MQTYLHRSVIPFAAAVARGLAVACVALGLTAAQSATAAPSPTVTGPIPATATPGDPSHAYPFFASNIDLASRGYIEEEYFFEGTANTYNVNPLVSKLHTAIVTGSGFPYKTRMVVRRPISAKDFNGTVLMEWQNVTAGYEPDALWLGSNDHFIRRGYTWIGVSAQRAGMHAPVTGLRAWSPARYGTLGITNDGLSWDIFSQAAQSVRHPRGVDPMAGLPVDRVIAMGWSQSAGRLVMYHNSIHPLANVFDAFAPIGVDGAVLLPLRTDLAVKVFKVQPETNVAGNGVGISQALLRVQEPATDHFRRWEVAGAAQLAYHEAQAVNPLQARDLPPIPPPACDLPPWSRIPWHYVINAAYDHMVDWVQRNVEPPVGPDIEVVSLGNVSVLARDSFGNALGGIRLPQHDVPTATNTGLNTPVATSCRWLGSHEPLDAATLAALYRNHGSYVSAVTRAVTETTRAGFMVLEDAQATRVEAAGSAIGKP